MKTMTALLVGLLVCPLAALPLHAADPVVSNVRASQRAGDKLVDILYDLADADGGLLDVTVEVSIDGGATFDLPATHFSGNGYGTMGAGVVPGANKQVVWDARADWDGNFSPNVRFRITADDSLTSMALIPAGKFVMGDSVDYDSPSTRPTHTNDISTFYIGRYEVTKALWDEVRTWANTNGYDLGTNGAGKAANHPVQTVSWYDVVKWCNARSEKEGLWPAYYTDASQTGVYRSGQVDLQNAWVEWSNGYRLPTEAEWEKASRAGAVSQRFPWSATNITHSMANYRSVSSSSYPYDTSPTTGYHPNFQTGGTPFTSPVGYFPPNAYGLYDMAGNVVEWTWDCYDAYSSVSQTNPRGPDPYYGFSTKRMSRGGSWEDLASYCRSADRRFPNNVNNNYAPGSRISTVGFRVVLAPDQP